MPDDVISVSDDVMSNGDDVIIEVSFASCVAAVGSTLADD